MADRERLTSNTTIYFDANAPDDFGDGSIGSPYQTLQYFFDNVITNIDTDIYSLTLQLAPGTYAPVDIGRGWAGQGPVRIVGDPSAPSDYVIEATAPGADAVRTRTGVIIPSFEVSGVEIRSAGGDGILYSHAGYGYFGNIVFGDVANAMVMTDNHLQFITSSGPITINGSAQYAQYADSGRIYWHHTTTFTADVEFQAFTRVGFAGFILGDHWNHDLNGHTVEGLRFLAEGGGIISANARGLDLFPGDEHGMVTRGGQYLSDDEGGSLPTASTDDVLRGDAFDNLYAYNGGMDFFDGRGGSDTLDLSDSSTAFLIDQVASPGEVYSRDGSVFFLYVTSVENIIGTLGNDIFRADTFENTYVYTGGVDIFDGRGGTDTLDLSNASTPVRIDLEDTTGEVYSRDGLTFMVDTNAVENFIGTSGDDVFRGDAQNNTYMYNGGRDIVDGRGGTDTLDLSAASNAVWIDLDYSGGEVYSRDGLTFMVDSNSVENAIGTSGHDVFRGTSQNNVYAYNGGLDLVDGRGGIDTLDLSDASSDVWIDLDYSGGEVYSRDGLTFMVDTGSIENAIGTSGDDVFRGDAQDNVYTYNGGLDVIDGRAGTDTVDFSPVDGSVRVDLGQGRSDVSNRDGSTFRVTTASVETVIATGGNDTLIGDAQNNVWRGNGGNDTFVFGPDSGVDRIVDFVGGPGSSDVLDVSAYGFANAGEVLARATQVGADTVFDFGSGDTLTLSAVTRSSLVADDFLLA